MAIIGVKTLIAPKICIIHLINVEETQKLPHRLDCQLKVDLLLRLPQLFMTQIAVEMVEDRTHLDFFYSGESYIGCSNYS